MTIILGISFIIVARIKNEQKKYAKKEEKLLFFIFLLHKMLRATTLSYPVYCLLFIVALLCISVSISVAQRKCQFKKNTEIESSMCFLSV